jgi:hypothetical protein
MLEEAVLAHCEVIYWYYPGGSEETHEYLRIANAP